jgi:hypothetical protein
VDQIHLAQDRNQWLELVSYLVSTCINRLLAQSNNQLGM